MHNCPQCGSNNTWEMGSNDCPEDEDHIFHCHDCGYDWKNIEQ